MYDFFKASLRFQKIYNKVIKDIENSSYEDLMAWDNEREKNFTVLDYIMQEKPELVTENVLGMKGSDGWTVAYALASNGKLPEKYMTENVLGIKNRWGTTVAYALASNGKLPEKYMTENVLGMEDDYGWTVAHVLVWNGNLPVQLMTENVLGMKDHYGTTVAYELAERGDLPVQLMTENVLGMKNRWGWTVAHSLARSGKLPENLMTENILGMKNSDGKTVAHVLVKNDFSVPSRLITKDFLNKPTFTATLINNLSRKSEPERIDFASLLPSESLEFILRSKKIRNLDNSDILINAVKTVVEKTAEQEALENVSTGDLSSDLPDLYGSSSPSCSSLEEAKDLILSGGSDREAGINYLNEKFGEVMAKPMIEEIMKEEKKKETKDKTSPDRER